MLTITDSESTTARQTGALVSFAEMCKQVGYNHVEVTVHSYGYTTSGVFGHYEPFKVKHEFTFVLDWFEEIDEPLFWLRHVTYCGKSFLHFACEDKELFWKDEQGRWYCNDPELKEDPDDNDE